MPNLQFLFSAALWALPLAGLPLILHLLFRQKSPIVPFSTLRFIQSSLKQNAARRKIQRWLLLACRALLLALLIWALAQPARQLSAGLFSGGSSLSAAIVVDTSYSMMLEDDQTPLLHKADAAIQDLLRTELRDADVALFREPDSTNPPRLQPAENYRGEHWAPLSPSPAPVPLIDRIKSASDLLASSGSDRKWLVILTDDQSKEFPRPLSPQPDLHTLLIDLHPSDVRTAAITNVHTDPPQPRLGIPAQITIDLNGHPGDGREVSLDVTPAGQLGAAPPTTPLPLAHFDSTGRASLHTPLVFSASSWLQVTAHLTAPQPLPWATTRTDLVQIAPRQIAAILPIGLPNPLTIRMIRLALDPSEGQRPAWPLTVRDGAPHWDEALVVAVLNQWPDAATTQLMNNFATSGGCLVLFIQPGLADSWAQLDASRQFALSQLLPSPPQPDRTPDAAYHASILRPNDPILADIGDPRAAEGRLTVTRLTHFAPADFAVQPIINAAPADPDSGAQLTGLLFRRSLGRGLIYTWATLPDRTCGNLRVWDIFPPTLVNAAQPPAASLPPANVEIGQPLTFPAALVPGGCEVDIITPPNQTAVKVERDGDQYPFRATRQPGLYAWRWRRNDGQNGLLAWANVQLPAAEADLRYRPLTEIAPESPNVITGHSLAEVRRQAVVLAEPRPQWTLPIALVLLLLCFESLLGALPRHRRLTPSLR